MSLSDFFAFERSFAALSLRVSSSLAQSRNRAASLAPAPATGWRALLPASIALMAIFALPAAAAAQTAGYGPVIESLGDPVNYPLSLPEAIAVDSNGNVYVGDFGSGVTEMTPNCASSTCMTTLGGGQISSGGGFAYPSSIAVDSSGNVYVVDPPAGALKKMPPNCLTASCVTTLVTGFSTYVLGVALDSSGNIYVADQTHSAIREFTPGCAALSCAITVGGGFDAPQGVAVDAGGNVYVAVPNELGIFEVPPGCASASCTIQLGGSGFHARAVAVDASGNVYVAAVIPPNQRSILEMPPGCASASCVTTLSSNIAQPYGVAVDASRNVYVADFDSAVADEILSVGGISPPLPPNFGSVNVGSSTSLTLTFTFSAGGSINPPAVLTQGAPNLDFTDAGTGTCTSNGTAHTYSSGDTCTVTVNFMPRYPGERVGAVELLNTSGVIITTVDISGTGVGPQITYSSGLATTFDPTVDGAGLYEPLSETIDAAGNLYIADSGNNRVIKVPAGGGAATSITPSVGGTGLSYPDGLAVDGAGNLYISDLEHNRIIVVPADGSAPTAIVPSVGLSGPAGLRFDGAGDLFIADDFNNNVVEILANGGAAVVISPVVNGIGLLTPTGVAVDTAGNLYIADQDNQRVVEVPAGGGAAFAISPTVNGVNLKYPSDVAVDAAGDLYIADSLNGRVVEVPAGGGTPVAFDPIVGGRGIKYAGNVALDAAGDLFIVDYINSNVGNRMIEIQFSQPAAVNFAAATGVGTLDTTDGTQTVSIANVGNSALNLTGLSYPTDFPQAAGDSNPCTSSTSLSAGMECDLPIEFYPQSSGGSLSETITLTDNNLNVTGAQQTITVNGIATHAVQTITFPFPVSGTAYSGGSAALSATSTSGLPVGFLSTTKSVCSVSGSISTSWSVSFIAPGECSIEAYQWGNSSYSAATFAFQNFYVHGQAQTISFAAIATPVYSGNSVTLAATASSSLAVSFISTTPTICTVSNSGGWSASLINGGTCTIEATQAGNATYAAATPVKQSFIVSRTPQAISFPAITQPVYVGGAVTPAATASSGLAVSYVSTTPAICTISGSGTAWTINLLASGQCTVEAEQAGNTLYAIAPSVTQHFFVHPAP
jgi:sugar lactone lactonase YvrE